MCQPRQLLVTTLAILLFSCNSPDRQKEQTPSPSLTQETTAVASQKKEIKSETKTAFEKKAVAFKTSKTQKAVSVNSNPQIQT